MSTKFSRVDREQPGRKQSVRRRTVSVVVTVVALLLTGCTPNVRWVSPTSGGAASASASASGTAIRPPVWRACRDEAAKLLQGPGPSGITYDCGTIEGPQDRYHPDPAKTFHIP